MNTKEHRLPALARIRPTKLLFWVPRLMTQCHRGDYRPAFIPIRLLPYIPLPWYLLYAVVEESIVARPHFCTTCPMFLCISDLCFILLGSPHFLFSDADRSGMSSCDKTKIPSRAPTTRTARQTKRKAASTGQLGSRKQAVAS